MSAIRLTEQGADPTRPDPYALTLTPRLTPTLTLTPRFTRPAYPPILAYGVTELISMIRFSYQIALGDSANRTEWKPKSCQQQQQRQQRQQ
jgi:hypothetical protein